MLLPLAVLAMISNLNVVAQGKISDGTWNCVTVGREVDAELEVSLLDEELVADDFDRSRFADLGMRGRHRIPVDDDGLARLTGGEPRRSSPPPEFHSS